MMLKKSITYVIAFALLGFLGFTTHNFYTEEYQINLPFSLLKVYVFFAVFSLIICLLLNILSTVKKMENQIGLYYLASIFLKLPIFGATFYNSIFKITLNTNQRLSLVIPMMVFLAVEVFFIAKILSKKSV